MDTKLLRSRKEALLSYIATGKGTLPQKLYSREEQLLKEIGDRLKNISNISVPENATKEKAGVVKMADKVDAVSTEDATNVSGTSADEGINKIVALANANKTTINAILTALKNAGIISNN